MNVDFEYEIGDFVVRRTPVYEQTTWDLGTPAGYHSAHAVVARGVVDEGNGPIIYYRVRSTASDVIIELRGFELESWESYAVRHKLTERNALKVEKDTGWQARSLLQP